LKELLGPQQVLTKLIERLAHAGDASIYRLTPLVVAMPRNDEEVRKLLRYCADHRLHLAFRAAGTSLSGQAVTDGILVSLGRYWRRFEILDGGRAVSAEPGVVGGRLNAMLLRYGSKIGPDPASISSAMIGGIVANNASGLCCGTDQNSYKTLRGMRLILADGFTLDTAAPDAGARLRDVRPDISQGLLEMRREILARPDLASRIRHKYQIKNTTGYSLNAFVDFEDPVEILAHLMVGSEGTLGFISQVSLDTVPLAKFWATALIFFRDLSAVGEVVLRLREIGAAVVEFMDRASMLSVQEDMSYGFDLTPNCAALLVEFQEDDEAALAAKITAVSRLVPPEALLEPFEFTMDPDTRNRFWGMRKGIYPTVGAMRTPGTSVIIEDVVFPVRRMPQAISEVQDVIFRSGFTDGVIFGHAKEGNLHPVITQDFADPGVVDRYARFMNELADLVLNRYDGSFKGEHGTGRNVAPFVELEWGEEAYDLMRRIKRLLDPDGILNPGVILNDDPKVHLKDLKTMPVFSEIADPCIECGFCEVRCPSQDLTLTPRQRIAVRRQIVELARSRDGRHRRQAKMLEQDYLYYGIDTCAVDGMCALACPVKIDTGRLTRELRGSRHSRFQHALAHAAVRRFGLVTAALRTVLRLTDTVERLFGKQALVLGSRIASKLTFGTVPALSPQIPLPGPARPLPRPPGRKFGRTVVYFPSCLTRTLGPIPGERDRKGLAETILFILERGGWDVVYPGGISHLCCGQPFSSKGFIPAAEEMTPRLVRALWKATEHGTWPVMCDTSPCSGHIIRAAEYLREPELIWWRKMKVYDMSTFLVKHVLPDVKNLSKLPVHAVLHPTCTIMKIGAHKDMVAAAEMCAEKVTVPVMAECCGFAGDRGFRHPELTLSATAQEAKEVMEYARFEPNSLFLSTCRTCEVGVTAGSGLPYQSIAYLVADAIRAGERARPESAPHQPEALPAAAGESAP